MKLINLRFLVDPEVSWGGKGGGFVWVVRGAGA